MPAYSELILQLEYDGIIQSPTIKQAFEIIERQHFIPDHVMDQAGKDIPIPIGFHQTNSQPRTVAMMLGWLDLADGHVILDIGSGSGWTTALMATIVGPNGRVDGIERIPELVHFGQSNLSKYKTLNATITQATSQLGNPNQTYDRILVSAAAERLPEELLHQLAPNGILVIPIKNTIHKLKKYSNMTIQQETFPGFRFVPLC
jgi:protein-L-isoaspartate(D-aspartate) O-methyltransferase